MVEPESQRTRRTAVQIAVPFIRSGRRRRGLVPFGLTLCGLLACSTARPRPMPEPTRRQQAQASTLAGDWNRAAARWTAIFYGEGGLDLEAGLEASRALMNIEEWRSAQEVIEQGLQHFPDHLDLLQREAFVLERLGYRRAAEARFRRLEELGGERPEICYEIGRLRLELGLEDAAVEALTRCVELNPGDAQALKLLARAQAGSQRAREAFDSYSRLFTDFEPSVEDYYPAAGLWRALEEDPDAEAIRRRCREWLEASTRLDPQHAPSFLQLGLLHEREGSVDRAETAYRRAIELDPTSLPAVTNLAVLYADAGREPEAREMVERAVALEGDRQRRAALRGLLERFEAPEDGAGEADGATNESTPARSREH